MPNPTTIADLESRWRPLTEDESVNATALLEDAWVMLLARRPSVEANIAAGTVAGANVRRVVCAIVLRVLRNPEGKLEEAIDDYRYRRDSLISSGVLHVTPDELADITPGRNRNRSTRLVIYGDE